MSALPDRPADLRSPRGLWESHALDVLAALGIACAAGACYVRTLPPSILDGDSGRWQYVGNVLGIPYVTGFPGLVLLSKLWTELLPIGSVAYRMSLFSAVCGALAIGLAYCVFRLASANRLASALCAAAFALLPSTWWWSISVKAYSLNLLFVAALFVLLLLWSRARRDGLLWVAALLYGLSLTNHNTMVLFLPAFAVFVLWTDPALLRQPRRLGTLLLVAAAPLAVYLYIPLRGGALWAALGSETGLPWPVSVSRGLISSEYTPDWPGFWRLILAQADTGGLLHGWAEVPAQLTTVYVRLLLREFTWVALLPALAGWILLIRRDRRPAALFLLGWVAFPPLVVKYGHGMQSAFLLPANLMIAAGQAVAWSAVLNRARRMPGGWRWAAPTVVSLGLVLIAVLPVEWQKVDRSGDRAVADYWDRILQHPMEDGAGVVAHSGTLTPLWYLQNVEGRRNDLRGLFPPSAEVLDPWLAAGNVAYLAGPLDGWLPDAAERYRLTPWGILTRLEGRNAPGEPALPRGLTGGGQTLGDSIEFLGCLPPGPAESGGNAALQVYWRALRDLSPDYLVSARLVGDEAARTVVSSVEDRLVSAWYPGRQVPAGRLILDVFALPVLQGTAPGRYRLQFAVYHPETGESLGSIDVGPSVEVKSPSVAQQPSAAGLDHASNAEFDGQIRLVGFSLGSVEVWPGQTVQVEALWQALRRPAGDCEVRFEWVSPKGETHPAAAILPEAADRLTSAWAPGDLVRTRHRLIAPGDSPPGGYRLHAGWVNPSGSRLSARSGPWPWPRSDSVELGVVEVRARPRTFEAPPIAHPMDVRFGDRVRLLGYQAAPDRPRAGEEMTLTLFWQAIGPTDRPYTVFVHLVDDAGRVLSQRDVEPGNGRAPTCGWAPGEILTEEYSLPVAAPSPAYRVRLGLYDPLTGRRLVQPGQGADAVEIGPFVPRD